MNPEQNDYPQTQNKTSHRGISTPVLIILGIAIFVLGAFTSLLVTGKLNPSNRDSSSEYSSDNDDDQDVDDEDSNSDSPRRSSRNAYNSNQQAIASELNNYASMVIQWWKTPVTQGGAGQEFPPNAQNQMVSWLGFGSNPEDFLTTDTGKYKVALATNPENVQLWGIGTEWRDGGYPMVKTTCNLVTSTINSTIVTDEDGKF